MWKNSFIILSVALCACDRSGVDLVPETDGDFAAVIELGEIGVMTRAQLSDLQNAVMSGSNPQEWCDSNQTADGKRPCYFGILGQAGIGTKGGATMNFQPLLLL